MNLRSVSIDNFIILYMLNIHYILILMFKILSNKKFPKKGSTLGILEVCLVCGRIRGETHSQQEHKADSEKRGCKSQGLGDKNVYLILEHSLHCN